MHASSFLYTPVLYLVFFRVLKIGNCKLLLLSSFSVEIVNTFDNVEYGDLLLELHHFSFNFFVIVKHSIMGEEMLLGSLPTSQPQNV